MANDPNKPSTESADKRPANAETPADGELSEQDLDTVAGGAVKLGGYYNKGNIRSR